MSDDTEERRRRTDALVDAEEEVHKYVVLDPESEDFEIHADQRAVYPR